MEYKQLKSYHFQAPFYALMPTIWTEDNELYIKTSFFQCALSLFSHGRIVNISKDRKIVEIKIKKWWRWKSPIRITFSKIDYIDLTPPKPPVSDKDHPDDIHELFLITKDPFRRVVLFRFKSIVSTNFIMAISCANFIMQHMNIRFVFHKNYEMPLDDFNDKYICTACGHRLHPNSEFILCPYCGGKEIRIVYFKDDLPDWKSYPNHDVEIERRYRRPSGPYIRSYLYVLALTVGLVIFIIFIYITSPRTVSNINILANSQSTNKSIQKSEDHEAVIAGYNFYKKGDFNNAIAEYAEAIENDPNNNEAYFYRGAAFLKTGEDDKALSDLKRSIELDPHHFESYQNLEWILAKRGEFDTIIIYWNEFLELEPEHAQAYLNRGRAYYHQGSWDAALKDAKKSCDLGNSEGCMRYKQLKEKMGN